VAREGLAVDVERTRGRVDHGGGRRMPGRDDGIWEARSELRMVDQAKELTLDGEERLSY